MRNLRQESSAVPTEDARTYGHRLHRLIKELNRRGLDGFLVPNADEHGSEYIGSYAKRLQWLTGFTGSGAAAVVLTTQATLFVDRRYTLQARQQVDARQWDYESLSHRSVAAWLVEHVHRGARIGYDPWLHTAKWVTSTQSEFVERGVQLVPVADNPIDALWSDRPAPSLSLLWEYPSSLAGRTSREKREDICAWLAQVRADAVILTALDSIAWTFNIRAWDVPRSPVALAFALVNSDGTASLFVDLEKLTPRTIQHLGPDVHVYPRQKFVWELRRLASHRVSIDPGRTAAAIEFELRRVSATIVEARDPVVLPKSIKNHAEINGHRRAQLRDGVAVSRFLHWLDEQCTTQELTELSAAEQLRSFREQTGALLDLSFDTISAVGPDAAMPHYRPSSHTNRRLEPGTIYLVDSGGQYIDGTTDITRTIAIGMPTTEMRNRFTRVLQGHIALATAVFPPGTKGGQLDILARQPLWAIGLDYGHGTGHGVGACLCVHEGPQRIFNPAIQPEIADEPLRAGMILSNEPGYYKPGEYGIRIENLMLVVERKINGSENTMLGFEILTHAPIDRTLIDVSMLLPKEIAWINMYHANVWRVLEAEVPDRTREWLHRATQALV